MKLYCHLFQTYHKFSILINTNDKLLSIAYWCQRSTRTNYLRYEPKARSSYWDYVKTSSLLLIVIFLGLVSCKENPDTPFWPPEKSPEIVAQKVIKDLLNRGEYMMYETSDATAVHYAEVCAAYGAARISRLLSDSVILSQLSERYLRVLTDSIVNTANHVDANVYGILPLELHMQTPDSVFFQQGMELADGQWIDPLPNGLTNQTRFWIDDVWMIGSLQIQAYRATGKTIYLDRAAIETIAYLEKLQQSNGLFHHGENAPFFWGRGNGWMAAGLAVVLSELPADHVYFNQISEGYETMMKSLIDYQAEDGMWRQLVNEPSAWKETSCTAMFGYAISVGVKRNILTKKEYETSYQKAWLALTEYVNKEGKITDVCVGTGQSTDINYYLDRPTITGDFHGQAPLLWFAYSLLSN